MVAYPREYQQTKDSERFVANGTSVENGRLQRGNWPRRQAPRALQTLQWNAKASPNFAHYQAGVVPVSARQQSGPGSYVK